jgi:hypothetical protein
MNFHEFSDKKQAVDIDNEQIIQWMKELKNGNSNFILSGNTVVNVTKNKNECFTFHICKNFVEIEMEKKDFDSNWEDIVDCILNQYEY